MTPEQLVLERTPQWCPPPALAFLRGHSARAGGSAIGISGEGLVTSPLLQEGMLTTPIP